MRILLVEDEVELARAICTALQRENFLVDVASTLLGAEEAIIENLHDIVILDRGLPDGDGLDLLKLIRSKKLRAAVLVLTARTEVVDKVHSLDVGADDMLAKPFATDELLARIRALARRPSIRTQRILTVGNLDYDLQSQEVSVGSTSLALPRRELLVLSALLERNGRVVRREDLQELVYGYDDDIQSNALDSHVSKLRVKLDHANAGLEIHAIRGLGYLLCVTT